MLLCSQIWCVQWSRSAPRGRAALPAPQLMEVPRVCHAQHGANLTPCKDVTPDLPIYGELAMPRAMCNYQNTTGTLYPGGTSPYFPASDALGSLGFNLFEI